VVPRTSPQALVYNGTSSSYQDVKNAKKRVETDQRRAISDKAFAASRAEPDYARMRSHSLAGQAHVILAVLGAEKKIVDWLQCDISTLPQSDGNIELMLLVPCPVCVLKLRRPTEDSIMQIRQSNRGFTLDTKGQGELWVNPNDPREVYIQAGTVSTHDPFRCDNGCHTKYQIDKNVIRIV
jgi:hypothetical protein